MEKKLRLALFLKMFVGFMLGFLLAEALRLPASYTAGVIAILHLWYSRESVFKGALTRLVAAIIGLAVSAFIFHFFNYNYLSLFAMVLIILSLLYLLKLEYGSTIALVLIGQQWGLQTPDAPLNALYIMLIGTGIALILNLITFRRSKTLSVAQKHLDTEIAAIFTTFKADTDYDFSHVKKALITTKSSLKIALENYRVDNILQTLAYINMRGEQIKVLEKIVATLKTLAPSPYKDEIINYLDLFKERIGETDYASDLLVKHDELLTYYRGLALPKTRSEFEHRASLFAILSEIKQFLVLKREYHESYPAI